MTESFELRNVTQALQAEVAIPAEWWRPVDGFAVRSDLVAASRQHSEIALEGPLTVSVDQPELGSGDQRLVSRSEALGPSLVPRETGDQAPGRELPVVIVTQVQPRSASHMLAEFLALDDVEGGRFPEAVAAFASSYGWLGYVTAARAPGSPRVMRAEPIAVWRRELSAAWDVLMLWRMSDNLVAKQDELGRRELRQFVRSVGADEPSNLSSARQSIDTYESRTGQRLPWKPLRSPHTASSRDKMIEVIGPHSGAKILFLPPKQGVSGNDQRLVNTVQLAVRTLIEEKLRANFSLEVDLVRRRFVFRAGSLLGALYLELANFLVGRARGTTCAVCGRWFVAARRDARTCSPKCRIRLYRDRRSERQAATQRASTV